MFPQPKNAHPSDKQLILSSGSKMIEYAQNPNIKSEIVKAHSPQKTTWKKLVVQRSNLTKLVLKKKAQLGHQLGISLRPHLHIFLSDRLAGLLVEHGCAALSKPRSEPLGPFRLSQAGWFLWGVSVFFQVGHENRKKKLDKLDATYLEKPGYC